MTLSFVVLLNLEGNSQQVELGEEMLCYCIEINFLEAINIIDMKIMPNSNSLQKAT